MALPKSAVFILSTPGVARPRSCKSQVTGPMRFRLS